MPRRVIVVGAGLAGLCCARRLCDSGCEVQLLESADAPGGRIRTDRVDGFLLDRGFQTLLSSYPEARGQLDLAALNLHAFQPGALVRHRGGFHKLCDPWRTPWEGVKSLITPVGSLADKVRIARLRRLATDGSLESLLGGPETPSLEFLQQQGFSATMIDSFFRPFLGGVFLDGSLATSSKMLLFVFRMFATGDACLPESGMQAIPEQLAAELPHHVLRLQTRVEAISEDAVTLASGEHLAADAVVIAAGPGASGRLLDAERDLPTQGVTCLYYSAPAPPVTAPMLVLDGEGGGPVNNLCVPSSIAPSYAPSCKSLISASVLGIPDQSDDELSREVIEQCRGWFGDQVGAWSLLRVYRIADALPQQLPGALSPSERPVKHATGVYVCGDHLDNASIQGAMTSGRRAAEAVLVDLGG
ncbi:protoporphyrinogen oxidase [Posidoniimonas corsicana]|uniref:Protoporphyrinogen oxidase n=1 Tax=Posidoniimonas corsicana TaxID=1938618 RepID=A0A5C5VBD9_9BACT|nr:NAD(P)/FAD-dependent oxidoreductase [Posidoniimonas corsicana]TWT35287.1 protoporphyrinogen oxidase [Posidoniimonas corsicana]